MALTSLLGSGLGGAGRTGAASTAPFMAARARPTGGFADMIGGGRLPGAGLGGGRGGGLPGTGGLGGGLGTTAPEGASGPAFDVGTRFETIRPDAFRPELILPDVRPDVFRPPTPMPRVATQLARNALELVGAAPPNVVNEAIAAAHNASVPPGNLMAFLARKVLVGEVLGGPAASWSAETRSDFAQALNVASDRLEVMDALVGIAVLNDPDLEEELRGENLVPPTEADLLGARRVVWQYPPPGTPLQPPYVVLIAVEHQQVAAAEETVQSILGDLVVNRGFRLPRAAAARL